jgi:hypothetical protein
VSSRPAEGGAPASAASGLEIRTEPTGATVYVDWKVLGTTPVVLPGKASGLLLLEKDGYKAAFRPIRSDESGVLEFNLAREGPGSRQRLILLGSDRPLADVVAGLRGRLVEEGFTVLGVEEAVQFERERQRAGGLSNAALRAWARARFGADVVVMARVRESSRPLSEQELRYLGIQDAAKGVVRTEVGVELEALDLRSGDALGAVSAQGSGFGLDPKSGLEKALGQATTESAKRLRQRIPG